MPVTKLGTFEMSSMQILDEHGNLDADLEPNLSRDQLEAIYRYMVFGREGDQRMLKLQRQGRMGTFAPCSGQEAVSVGTAAAMTQKDWFVTAFRELAGQLMRGVPLWKHYLYYNGWEEGNVTPEAPRTLPIAVIVASQVLHGVGLAHAMRYKGEKDAAAVIFFGDGATSEGDFHEALNFASVWQSPAVFVCANNQWAISIPREKQTRSKSIAQKAIAYDMPGIQVDGNDVLAVYRATREALDRAYAGEGPTLIEAVTYRVMMHSTADDPTKYRSEEEVQAWWKKDPIIRFEKYLLDKGIDPSNLDAIRDDVKREVDRAVKEFEEKQGSYSPDAPFDHVFATPHPYIEQQRAEFLRSLQQEVNHG